jgi:hypothetical protein
MTQNQFIQEKVLGKCWHEWNDNLDSFDFEGPEPFCNKCGYKEIPYGNPNFYQPSDWWELWEFCKGQEWWDDFIDNETMLGESDKTHGENLLSKSNPLIFKLGFMQLIDLHAFPEAIARYYGWEGENIE